MTSHTLPAAVLMVIGTDVGFWGASPDNHNFLYPPPVAGPRVLLTSALSISLIIKLLARAKFVGNHPPACHVPCISFLMALKS